MSASVKARRLRGLISIEKGKPPLIQPYHGSDSEVYLSPQLLRGKTAMGETVKVGSNAVHAEQGDTIIIWDGANSGEILLGRPGVVPSTMARINHDARFLPQYFYYALKRWEHYLKAQTSGSRVQHVDRELLENLEILDLSAPVQQRIAETLIATDQAIDSTERLVAKAGLIRAGLLVDLLTNGVDEAGEIRTEHTHVFRDSTVGRIPAEWEVCALGSVADISSGATLGGPPTGPNTVELPYLRVANVQDGYLDLREVKSIRVPSASVNKYLLQPGDVLMNEGGDFDKLGRGTVWRGEIDRCLHQNHVFKVRPHAGVLDSDFLAAVSASSYGKSFFILASKQSTNLASINATQLRAFPIPRPDYDEQLRIVEILHKQTAAVDMVARQLAKLRAMREGLVQDLLSGRKQLEEITGEQR
ncbi:restriction endonuclease subunit S [Blastococcus sp. SYSU DS1021]